MILVVGAVARVAVEHLARGAGEGVRDPGAMTILTHRTIDLGGRGRAPEERGIRAPDDLSVAGYALELFQIGVLDPLDTCP
jgi:hypothetical protein